MERPARAAVVGAVIAALITLPGLGAGTLWDNSETAYGEVAREILLSGNWLVMHLNGDAWYVQPPLWFWIAALCAKLFGVTSFALRLPAALATIAMGGATGYAVARQAGTRAGVFASVVLSSCVMQAVIGRLAIMDALLDLCVTLAILWWLRALQTGSDRYALFGWIAVALGFMVKGPVAPVMALLVVVPYALWNRRAEEIRMPSARAWAWSAAAFLAIVAPWFVAVTARRGAAAVAVLIGHYTIGRYTGVIENQSGPVWYYLAVLIVGFFPWIAFLPVALVWAGRRLKRRDTTPEIARLLRLAIAWIVVPIVFFSFAKTKLPNYIALETPALGMLVGLYLDGIARSARRLAGALSVASVPIFIGLLAIAIALFARDNRLGAATSAFVPDLAVMGAAIFAGALVTLVLILRRGWIEYSPYGLGVATIVAFDVLALFALPRAERFKPIPSLAAAIDARLRPGDAVAIQENVAGSNALLFYTRPPVYTLATSAASRGDDVLARAVICGAPRVFVVAPGRPSADDPAYGRDRHAVARAGKDVLLLYDGPGCRRT